MFRAFAMLACTLMAWPGWAQMTPVGLWHTVDDSTGQPKSEIRIEEHDGVLRGRIERLLRPGADLAARCTACKDDRRDQPMVGLEIIRGARQAEGRHVWQGGRILDPESGRSYRLRLAPIDGGRRLEVRGSLGPFGRTQTWTRVP